MLKFKKPLHKLAIDNFLGSMDMTMPKRDQIKNAVLDSALYKWSNATYTAILDGIDEAYAKKEQDEVNGSDKSSA